MLSIIKTGVILSCIASLISLSILVRKTFSFTRKPLYAKPRQGGIKGILFAFGRGMMPWEKESAAKHLATYIGGIIYHVGIFGALFYLFAVVFSFELPESFILPFRTLLSLASLCGLAFLGKRILLPGLKKISCPDDFFANGIVEIFLVFTLVHTYASSTAPFFFLLAIVMFLYIPMGKIRHCFFFFYSKILFGLFFGRRGVLPPKTHEI